MSHSAWTDLCKQPTLSSSSEKYAQLVYDSTLQLHQPVQSILSALNLRAMGLAKCAHFESALRDVNVMQQLAPSSALGYLREAEVYSEQGKQLQVIRICNKGLCKAHAMDTHYETLQRAKMDAQQRQYRRIDFMAQLPTEIVMTALIPMFTVDFHMNSSIPSPYLQVSNLWRECIIQCFGGLRFEIQYRQGCTLSHLIQLTSAIKKLDGSIHSHEAGLYQFLQNNDFSSLRELTFRDYWPTCVDSFVSCLKSIGSTLTYLDLSQLDTSAVSMVDIMQSCPNLVSLEIYQPLVPDPMSPPTTTIYPKLTTLSFSGDGGNCVTSTHIAAIGESIPSLKKLSFYPCEDIHVTGVVLNYYPWMKSLTLQGDDHDIGARLTYIEQEPPCKETCITDLTIQVADPPNNV